MRLTTCIFSLTVAALMAGPAAAGVILVVPDAVAGVEGNSNNAFPFNSAPIRYQQVYSSAEFTSLTGPMWLSRIAFRPDAVFGVDVDTAITDLRIDLATTTSGVDAQSMTFDANLGPDVTTVFSGMLPVSSSATGGSPRPFDIIIELTTLFRYDPAAGNLVMDVRNFSGEATTQFDSVSNFAGVMSRRWALNPNAVTATTATGDQGLATQFTFVPEPSTLGLLAAAAILLLAARKFR